MLLTNSSKLPIRPGYSYEFEAGGFLCKDFVFTHPAMELVRVYVVWQPSTEGWLVHVKNRHEYRLIPTTEVLASFLRKVLEQRLPIWWWAEGEDYVGFAFPSTVAKSEDTGMASR